MGLAHVENNPNVWSQTDLFADQVPEHGSAVSTGIETDAPYRF
jgi:hypothetical protein